MNETKRFGISADFLKILALVTMAIDHFGAIVLEQGVLKNDFNVMIGNISVYTLDMILREIGRLAFPIFCFLIVEGFIHTSCRKNYAIRLFLFAFISEIPFDLAFNRQFTDMSYQNVFFTLGIGLMTIWCCTYFEKFDVNWKKYLGFAGCLAFGMFVAWIVHTDYSFSGVVLITMLYLLRGLPSVMRYLLSYACFMVMMFLNGGIWSAQVEAICIVSFFLLLGYNGVRRMKINKFVFYIFYPAHIGIFALISWFVIHA